MEKNYHQLSQKKNKKIQIRIIMTIMQMMIKKEKITINKIVCINSNNCKRNNQTSKKN